MSTQIVRWGILGVGDVCETKSGPAFQKAPCSQLTAVMRRNGAKAADFATRHNVPKWYDSVDRLLADKDIDAIYIASPPRYHLEHALSAIAAGKHIYLEKPMAMSVDECRQIIAAEQRSGVKAVIAHYRRALPAFVKIDNMIKKGVIGHPRVAEVRIFQPPGDSSIATSEQNWRWNPAVSGGGLFHDLAPHMLDLMLNYFGQPIKASGYSLRQNKKLPADDLVQGTILFPKDVIFQGCWSFGVAECAAQDSLTITGDRGQIRCDFFGEKVSVINAEGTRDFCFINPVNIQQPMIEQVVQYFLGNTPCPCSTHDGLTTIDLITKMTGTQH